MSLNLDNKINDLISTNEFISQHTDEEINLLNFFSSNSERLDEIVNKDEFEKKLLNDNLPNYMVDYNEMQ